MKLEMALIADGVKRALGADLMHAYRAVLSDVNDRTLTVPFFTGMGWDTDPNIGHVLSSLALDLSVDDPDEAQELGMTIRQWEEVKLHNDRVRSFFGSWADVLEEVAPMLEAVEGMFVDLDALRTAVDRARDLGEQHGTNSAEWWIQENIGGRASGDTVERARVILEGIDDSDPAVLDGLPFLDLSGQWADGRTVSDVLADLDVDFLDPDSDVAQEVVDAYRDGFDTAVEGTVTDACIDAGPGREV